VILDVVTENERWYPWSAQTLERCANEGVLAINPIIFAEISVGFERVEQLDEAVPASAFARLSLPWEAAFLAGKCFKQYRARGGARRSPLPDFYIGAHAAVEGMTLLTRDAARYRTYFPTLSLIAPKPPRKGTGGDP
jgi:hypothetical protein